MLALLPSVEADLRASGLIQRLETEQAETLQVDVDLAPAESVPVERGAVKTVPFAPLDPALYRETVRRALAEDLGWGDVTTEATIDSSLRARGVILAKSRLRDRRAWTSLPRRFGSSTPVRCSPSHAPTASAARREPSSRKCAARPRRC